MKVSISRIYLTVILVLNAKLVFLSNGRYFYILSKKTKIKIKTDLLANIAISKTCRTSKIFKFLTKNYFKSLICYFRLVTMFIR